MPRTELVGDLIIDMTDGENPIFAYLLRLMPEGGHVRECFGLGNRENLVEPDAVHDPRDPEFHRMPIAGEDPFPFRASARAERWAGPGRRGISPGRDWPAGTTGDDVADADRVRAELAAGWSPTVVVDGLISATPTGSINLRLRRQLDDGVPE